MQYNDKPTEFAAYRMLMAGANAGIDMLVVILVAVCFPEINSYVMCLVGLIVAAATLAFQVHVDHTLIFTGQYLLEDGESLYASIGIFGIGFGKKYHRSKKTLNSVRYFYIDHVRDVTVKQYGIRVKADVYTAASHDISVEETIFETPGAFRELLKSEGKKKSVTFRIEHNLLEDEEKRLLTKLDSLK